MKRSALVFSGIFLLTIISWRTYAQKSELKLELEGQTILTNQDHVPFWIRSNQFGSVPFEGASTSFLARARKDYSIDQKDGFDIGFGFEGRLNAAKDAKFILTEGFIKLKRGIFQIKAGRSKDVAGLNSDTSLTSGNWAVSGNALGIPKIEISIPQYYRLPVFDGLLSFKGSLSHGWLGKVALNKMVGKTHQALVEEVNTYFHQKSIYGRIGKSNWKFALFGGLNHQVFWGNEKKYYGDDYDISNTKNFLHVLSGITFENNKVPGSKVGNHLGSVDVGAQYNFKELQLTITRQFLYDAGALGHFANIADGITGIALVNHKDETQGFQWRKLLLEVIYTKNQAGEIDSKQTPSGDEDYYNNFIYRDGWSYKGENLGNPFLTTRKYAREDLVNDPSDHFINNRVLGLHLGFEGTYSEWRLLSKISYSQNHGTYKTSPIGNSIGPTRTPPKYGIFQDDINQLSVVFDISKQLPKNVTIGGVAAFDSGDLLHNSSGGFLRLIKGF